MGTEAAWVPLVIAAVGAGVQQYNTAQTAKKRDQEIARGIRESGKQQDRANQEVDQNLNELDKSRVDPFKKELQDTFIDKINAKRMLGLSGLNTDGSTSEAYQKGAGTAKTGAIDYAGTIASLLAGVDAAGNQRQAEGKRASDLQMDLNKFGRNADQDSFLAQLRASRHRDNPWLSIAASGLSGYASGMGGGGTAAAAGTGAGSTGVGEFNTGIGLDKYMYDPGAYRGING